MNIDFLTTQQFRDTDAMRFYGDACEDIREAIKGGYEAGRTIDEIATAIKSDPSADESGVGWGDMGKIEVMAEIVAPMIVGRRKSGSFSMFIKCDKKGAVFGPLIF